MKYNHFIITALSLLFLTVTLVAADEFVADDNTLLLLHFNNNTIDSSNQTNIILASALVCDTPGRFNEACEFNGIDEFVEVSHASHFEVEAGTIAFSFLVADNNRRQGLLSKDSFGVNQGDLNIRVEANNQVNVIVDDGSVTRSVNSNSGLVQPNTWYDVVLTFGPGNLKLYINGELADQEGYRGGLENNNEPFVIGASSHRSGSQSATPVDNFLQGKVDEVLVLDKALTAEEIANLHEPFVPGSEETGSDSGSTTGEDTGGDSGGDTGSGDGTGGDGGGDSGSETEEETEETEEVSTCGNNTIEGQEQCDYLEIGICTEEQICNTDCTCTIAPEVPTILIYSPKDQELLESQNAVINFNVFNWLVGNRGETHVHFHLDGHPDFLGTDHFMFYNIPGQEATEESEAVEPSGTIDLNLAQQEIEFATWLSQNSLVFNDLPEGEYTLSAHLVNELDQELENEESKTSLTFTVPSIEPEVTQDPAPASSPSSSEESTEESNNNGGGGGGGGCLTDYVCTEWSACDPETLTQTRECGPEIKYCVVHQRVPKPALEQECQIEVIEPDPLPPVVEKSLVEKVTDSIVESNKLRYTIITISALVILACLSGLGYIHRAWLFSK